jgi:MFS family permease
MRIPFFPLRRFELNKVIRTLTIHDVLYWGGYDMMQVIFALFVVNQIEGGSPGDVGLAIFLYRFSSTLFSIPIGSTFDKLPGLKDEDVALVTASILTGVVYLALAASTQLWHLFGLMLVLGVARAIDVNSWRKIFNSFLNVRRRGTELGMYDTFFSLGIAMMNVLAGYLSEVYGVRLVLLVAGVLVISSSFLPLIIRNEVKQLVE